MSDEHSVLSFTHEELVDLMRDTRGRAIDDYRAKLIEGLYGIAARCYPEKRAFLRWASLEAHSQKVLDQVRKSIRATGRDELLSAEEAAGDLRRHIAAVPRDAISKGRGAAQGGR